MLRHYADRKIIILARKKQLLSVYIVLGTLRLQKLGRNLARSGLEVRSVFLIVESHGVVWYTICADSSDH